MVTSNSTHLNRRVETVLWIPSFNGCFFYCFSAFFLLFKDLQSPKARGSIFDCLPGATGTTALWIFFAQLVNWAINFVTLVEF